MRLPRFLPILLLSLALLPPVAQGQYRFSFGDHGLSTGRSLAKGEDGRHYVMRTIPPDGEPRLDFRTGFELSAFTASGDEQWTRRFYMGGRGVNPHSVRVDARGRLYVHGKIERARGSQDPGLYDWGQPIGEPAGRLPFLLVYDPERQLARVQVIEGLEWASARWEVFLEPDGRAVMVGLLETPTDGQRSFESAGSLLAFLAFDPELEPSWAFAVEGLESSAGLCFDLLGQHVAIEGAQRPNHESHPGLALELHALLDLPSWQDGALFSPLAAGGALGDASGDGQGEPEGGYDLRVHDAQGSLLLAVPTAQPPRRQAHRGRSSGRGQVRLTQSHPWGVGELAIAIKPEAPARGQAPEDDALWQQEASNAWAGTLATSAAPARRGELLPLAIEEIHTPYGESLQRTNIEILQHQRYLPTLQPQEYRYETHWLDMPEQIRLLPLRSVPCRNYQSVMNR